MRHLKFVAVLMFVLAIGGRWAYADTISTFSLNTGTHQGGSIAGEIEIDVTTGLAGYGSFTLYTHSPDGEFPDQQVPFNAYFSTWCDACQDPPYYDTVIMSASSGGYGLNIEVLANTLVGYTGGPLCNGPLHQCDGAGTPSGWISSDGHDVEILNQANLVLVSSVTTPEPSSVALLMTGLLGLGGHVRRRLRKQNTVSEDGAA